MYTMEKDFSRKTNFSNVIEAEGRNFDINYSGILTKLIQECGRLCEHYASDLFITWSRIMRELENRTMETSSYLFGIREMGVDHTELVLSQYNNYGCYAEHEYRKIYRLDIIVEDDSIKMKLYEIDRPYNERGD